MAAGGLRPRTAMLTLIEGGDVYAPEHLGGQSIVLVDGKSGRIGDVDRRAVESIGMDVDVIDASGCMVCPGFIDPHEHLLGGSGEQGFATQTPEISLSEIVTAGITTVVGTLGVDTTMKTMAGLLAKAKGLREEGLSAYLWSGGYSVPPTSIMSSVREDMMFIDEVVGAGEIAIADERATEPTVRELAKLIVDTRMGGMLSGGGDPERLTVSSDASRKGPRTLFAQIRNCARGHRLPLAALLRLVTRNTSEVLKLERKGRLETGAHGDILVLEKDEFELVHVLARGKRMIDDGSLVVRERFLEESNRAIELRGTQV